MKNSSWTIAWSICKYGYSRYCCGRGRTERENALRMVHINKIKLLKNETQVTE